jgi:hypothetical protein
MACLLQITTGIRTLVSIPELVSHKSEAQTLYTSINRTTSPPNSRRQSWRTRSSKLDGWSDDKSWLITSFYSATMEAENKALERIFGVRHEFKPSFSPRVWVWRSWSCEIGIAKFQWFVIMWPPIHGGAVNYRLMLVWVGEVLNSLGRHFQEPGTSS